LTLTALGVVATIGILKPNSKNNKASAASSRRNEILEFINRYFGLAYFISSFAFFIAGLFLTLLLDSLGKRYSDNRTFEICNVILTGLLLLIGALLLLGGVDALARMTMHRRSRLIPGGLTCLARLCERIIMFPMLELILPRRTEAKAASEQGTVESREEKEKQELGTGGSSGFEERLEKRLATIEHGINDVTGQLHKNERTSLFSFWFGLGFTSITAAAAVSLALRSLGSDDVSLRILGVMLYFGGLQIGHMREWQAQRVIASVFGRQHRPLCVWIDWCASRLGD
jgi:hypothetical protein